MAKKITSINDIAFVDLNMVNMVLVSVTLDESEQAIVDLFPQHDCGVVIPEDLGPRTGAGMLLKQSKSTVTFDLSGEGIYQEVRAKIDNCTIVIQIDDGSMNEAVWKVSEVVD